MQNKNEEWTRHLWTNSSIKCKEPFKTFKNIQTWDANMRNICIFEWDAHKEHTQKQTGTSKWLLIKLHNLSCHLFRFVYVCQTNVHVMKAVMILARSQTHMAAYEWCGRQSVFQVGCNLDHLNQISSGEKFKHWRKQMLHTLGLFVMPFST